MTKNNLKVVKPDNKKQQEFKEKNKALNAAIRHAETPKPIKNLAKINPESVSTFEKIHAPDAANKSRTASVRRGP